jgi:stage II sporulation protein D
MRTRRGSRVAAALAVAAVGAVVPLVATAGPAAAAPLTFYRPADGVFHVAGHGYGHGHGMSQWGAYGGAQSGNTYRQILAWYYNNPAFGTATGTIKVQITSDGRGSDGRYDTQVKPASGLTAADASGHTLTLPAKASNGTAFDAYRGVRYTDGTLRVQGHEPSGWLSLAPGGGGPVSSWSGWIRFSASGGVLDLVRSDGSTEFYRDTLELDPTGSTSSAITVNRVTLEHYLAGVVSSEMPCGWTPTVGGTKRLDALESQAVAARSYAAWRRNNPRSSQVDVVDSTSDQAYHGYSAEKTALTACPWTTSTGTKTSAEAAAVAATAGQVMVDSAGKPIFAQYSASNGGYETSGGQTYLPSKPDAWDGVPTDSWNSHSWTDSVTAGQIQAAYPSIGTLSTVTITNRESLSGTDQNGKVAAEQWGGRITGMTLTGSAGSVTTTGASFASATGLMGPWFQVLVYKPSAPTSVSATPGDAQATVHWSAPTADGGGGIRSYRITASPAITPVTVSGTARSAVITGLSNDTSYVFSVAASNTGGTGPTGSAAAVMPSAHVVFHPLPPTRIVDTRNTGGALGAGVTRSVKVTGVAGVPATGVVDVALNVVSLDSTATSSVAVFPHGGPTPADPQLSWGSGLRVNAVVPVKVGSGGLVDFRNATGSTQLFVDVQGYYTPANTAGTAGDALTATTPTRLFDSRSSGGPIAAGGTRTVPVVGQGGVPAGATAAVVQLIAALPAQRNYVRAWGTGASRPAVYDLYAPANRYTDATAIVPLTSAGSLVVSPVYATNLIVVVLGWFTPATSSTAPGISSLLTPVHRAAMLTVPAKGSVDVASGLPSTAGSVVASLTGTGAVGVPLGVFASGQPLPAWASVNLDGVPTTATVVTPVGTGGKLTVHNWGSSSVQVVLDVMAWASR